MKKLLSLLLIGAMSQAILVGQASAALVNYGTFSQDTDAGYDWLHLTQTEPYSYDTVEANLGAGGLFEGWSIATFTQVHTLFDAAGGSGSYVPFSFGHDALRLNLLSGWGAGAEFTPGDIWVFVEDASPAGTGTGFSLGCYSGSDRYCAWVDGFQSTSTNYANHGVALVRSASAVPEPATFALLGLGLAGFGFVRRRRLTMS